MIPHLAPNAGSHWKFILRGAKASGWCLTALLLAACSGIPQHRANQYSADFQAWDAATQTRLLDERIQLGDSREMVYVALGPPLRPPAWTDSRPPRERWLVLVFQTDPPFPAGRATPLESSPEQPGLRAQSSYNTVWRGFDGPPARKLAIDFDASGRVVAWKLYPDADGLWIPDQFQAIRLPARPPPP